MKAFLQHDDSGLFYRNRGEWVKNPAQARAFPSPAEAEAFRKAQQLTESHAVSRFDPSLLARFHSRAPGTYQAGE